MRTHYCSHIHLPSLHERVTICGWVHSRRDHGGLIFVNLRDASGIVQVVFEPALEAVFALALTLRLESVICVEGLVQERPSGMKNPTMVTGDIGSVRPYIDAIKCLGTFTFFTG